MGGPACHAAAPLDVAMLCMGGLCGGSACWLSMLHAVPCVHAREDDDRLLLPSLCRCLAGRPESPRPSTAGCRPLRAGPSARSSKALKRPQQRCAQLWRVRPGHPLRADAAACGGRRAEGLGRGMPRKAACSAWFASGMSARRGHRLARGPLAYVCMCMLPFLHLGQSLCTTQPGIIGMQAD